MVSPASPVRVSISTLVDDLLGVPFMPGGRDPGHGLDCWGLVREVMGRLGVSLPDEPYSGECAAVTDAMVSRWRPRFRRLPGPQEPSLVLIRNDPIFCNHIGVLVDPARFIHTLEGRGVSVERIAHPLWRHSIVGYYEWIG